MGVDYKNVVCRVNCLASDLDSLYHKAALKLALSDSVMFVLYLVYENGGERPLADICKKTGISKQTLNSAVRKLENEGIIRLTQLGGRAKNVCLTDGGKKYVKKTVARLFEAECGAFVGWSESQINQYIELTEKYIENFRKQIEKM